MNKHLPPIKASKEIYEYPSWMGSHISMIDKIETGNLSDEEQKEHVVCKDAYGTYKTDRWRLDNGLTDPHRNVANRFGVLFKKAVKNK